MINFENPIKIYRDGNKWCALIGEGLQEGICGFGDTPEEALRALQADPSAQFLRQRIPQPGDRYRHWKGSDYVVMAIANILPSEEVNRFARSLFGWGVHTETSERFPIWKTEDGNYLIPGKDLDQVVIYARDEKLWVRPLTSFLEILGDTDNPDGGTMFYRFQFLGNP